MAFYTKLVNALISIVHRALFRKAFSVQNILLAARNLNGPTFSRSKLHNYKVVYCVDEHCRISVFQMH